MKKIALLVWLACPGLMALAGEGPWLTSFPDAATQAEAEHKLILLDFTGSDWCGWCMKLDEETFSRAEFIEFATNNLVLVRVDFPRHKSISSEQKKANHDLAKKYDVNGFPTVIIAKPDGTLMWDQRGYAPGGPNVMIDAANQCRRAAGLAVWAKPAPPPAPPPKPAAPAAVASPPAEPVKTTANGPKLGAIMYSAAHSSALIDGETCEEGDTVHGMRVVKITRDHVTLEYRGETIELKMN